VIDLDKLVEQYDKALADPRYGTHGLALLAVYDYGWSDGFAHLLSSSLREARKE